MKSVIKSWLRSSGYDFVQYVESPARPFDVLELVVRDRLDAMTRSPFVQIGANDGVRNDPLRHNVFRYKLRGLLVEPLPDVFERLRANYGGQPGLAFECCAVGESDGDEAIFRVRPDAPLPPWTQEIASFKKSHLSGSRFKLRELEQYVEQVRVSMLTLPSLLRKHGIDRISLLQVDTEGSDCSIVLAALREGLRPEIINYEYIHADPRQRLKCKRLLAECGYAFSDVGRDTLAVRQSKAPR
jgi:FkbM family methyltransferase